jgi:pyruvate dehydrogenase E2 component (dihydrolipoamide acetyltransferase)
MMQEFKLPDLGEGVHEGEIIDVLVAVGDSVEEGNPILTIETDKATVEMPSPFTGTVKEIRVKSGDMVKVGDVLMVFEAAARKGATLAPAPASEPKAGPELTFSPQAPAPLAAAPLKDRPKGPVPASPATRRLARELGVDLRAVPPTGATGLVTADDVRRFAEGARPASAAEAPPPSPKPPQEPSPSSTPSQATLPSGSDRWGVVQRQPLRSIRRAIAKQMAISWSQIPHVSHRDEVDVTELEALRRRRAPEVEAQGGKLTLTVFAIKAAVAALRKHPFFNASIDVQAEEIILKRYYNVGVATDTEKGLVVPVLQDVDRKSITEIAVELTALVQRTREGRASVDDMRGGTFTITNVGAIGGTGFSPIINHPEAAILGMGMARLQPKVIGDIESYEIIPRLMMPLVIAFDHRVVDGAEAARFLRMVMALLEDPEKLTMAL